MQDGLYCESCVPVDSKPAFFVFQISWKGINALSDYIDGERDLEVLETIDRMRETIDRKIILQIRSFIRGEIRESNPESMDEGDAES